MNRFTIEIETPNDCLEYPLTMKYYKNNTHLSTVIGHKPGKWEEFYPDGRLKETRKFKRLDWPFYFYAFTTSFKS